MPSEVSVNAPGTTVGPVFWTPNAARTRWFDGLSLMLPAAEALIVDTLEEALCTQHLPQSLADEVCALRQDERRHRVAHEAYNDRLAVQRLPMQRIEAGVSACIEPVRRLPLALRVRVLAAFEQCTALISEEALRDPAWLSGSRASAAQMWRWHCREEVAHHHAMLRLAHRMGQRTVSRVVLLPLVAAALALDSLRLQCLLLAEDTAAGRLSRWRSRLDRACFFLAVLPSLARMAVQGARAVGRRPA